MIAFGRAGTRTAPLAAAMVAGKVPPLAELAAAGRLGVVPGVLLLPQAAQAMASAATRAGTGSWRESARMMIILRQVVEDEVRPLRHPEEVSKRTALPPRTARRHRPGVRAHPPRGHHRCGTAPASHRLRWLSTVPGGPRDNPYCSAAGAGAAGSGAARAAGAGEGAGRPEPAGRCDDRPQIAAYSVIRRGGRGNGAATWLTAIRTWSSRRAASGPHRPSRSRTSTRWSGG